MSSCAKCGREKVSLKHLYYYHYCSAENEVPTTNDEFTNIQKRTRRKGRRLALNIMLIALQCICKV